MMLVFYVLLVTTAASARYLEKSPYNYEVSQGQVVLYGKPAPSLIASLHEAKHEKSANVDDQVKEPHVFEKKTAELKGKALSHDQPQLEEEQYYFPQQPNNINDEKSFAYEAPKSNGKHSYVYEYPSYGYEGSYDPTEYSVKLYKYKQSKYAKADDYEKAYDQTRYAYDPTYEQPFYGYEGSNEPTEHAVKLYSYKQAKYEKPYDPTKYAKQEKELYVYDPTYEKSSYGYKGSYEPSEHAVNLYSYKQVKYEKADEYEKSYDPIKHVYDPKYYVKPYGYEQPQYNVKAFGYNYPRYSYVHPQYQKAYGYELPKYAVKTYGFEQYNVEPSHSFEQKPTKKLDYGHQKYGVKTAYRY